MPGTIQGTKDANIRKQICAFKKVTNPYLKLLLFYLFRQFYILLPGWYFFFFFRIIFLKQLRIIIPLLKFFHRSMTYRRKSEVLGMEQLLTQLYLLWNPEQLAILWTSPKSFYSQIFVPAVLFCVLITCWNPIYSIRSSSNVPSSHRYS